MNRLLRRISVDPNVCFGKPCIRGLRVTVGTPMNTIVDANASLADALIPTSCAILERIAKLTAASRSAGL